MKKLKVLLIALFLLILSHSVYAQRQTVDLIVSGGTVVTMDANKSVIENGAVAVRGDKIVAVGKSGDITRRYASRQIIPANGKVVIPGLINTHTHIPMVLFRGISDDLDLQEWLTKYIFPA